jgi:hypothetical protein
MWEQSSTGAAEQGDDEGVGGDRIDVAHGKPEKIKEISSQEALTLKRKNNDLGVLAIKMSYKKCGTCWRLILPSSMQPEFARRLCSASGLDVGNEVRKSGEIDSIWESLDLFPSTEPNPLHWSAAAVFGADLISTTRAEVSDVMLLLLYPEKDRHNLKNVKE